MKNAIVCHLISSDSKAVNYLYDFIVFADSYEECKSAQLHLHALLRDLSFHIAYKKVVLLSTKVIYLGVEINSIDITLKLPQIKLDKLHPELQFFLQKRRATLRQLQRLAGTLRHCATLIRGSRTCSHRVISLLKCFKDGRKYVTLGKEFRLDLLWWNDFATFLMAQLILYQVTSHPLPFHVTHHSVDMGQFGSRTWSMVGGRTL